MIRIKTRHGALKTPVNMAIQAIYSSEFRNAIKKITKFDMSDDVSGDDILDLIKNHQEVIHVETYCPWWPWSKALAYFTPNKPNMIFINSRRLKRSQASIAGSIGHETVHLIDHHSKDKSFGHGNNSPVGKSKTAPYRIGELIKSLAKVQG